MHLSVSTLQNRIQAEGNTKEHYRVLQHSPEMQVFQHVTKGSHTAADEHGSPPTEIPDTGSGMI